MKSPTRHAPTLAGVALATLAVVVGLRAATIRSVASPGEAGPPVFRIASHRAVTPGRRPASMMSVRSRSPAW